MENTMAPQIVIVSGACCMPHLAKQDQAVEKVLQQALGELGLAVDIGKVSLSALLGGGGDLSEAQRQRVLGLFQRYGVSFTPAVMIDGQVRFAGGAPTVQQLTAALKEKETPPR